MKKTLTQFVAVVALGLILQGCGMKFMVKKSDVQGPIQQVRTAVTQTQLAVCSDDSGAPVAQVLIGLNALASAPNADPSVVKAASDLQAQITEYRGQLCGPGVATVLSGLDLIGNLFQ